jgi:hypothetical protein
MLQPELHRWDGCVPVFPVQPAPVLFRTSEPAGSVCPPVIYPGPLSDPQVAFGQYCLRTALFPALVSPLTVTFQPDRDRASVTPQLAIVAVAVCAVPFSVTPEKLGAFGVVENEMIAYEVSGTERASTAASSSHRTAKLTV